MRFFDVRVTAVVLAAFAFITVAGCGGTGNRPLGDELAAPTQTLQLVETLRLGTADPYFDIARGVVPTRDGDIHVHDGYNPSRILRFDSSGKHVGFLGGTGEGPGEFTAPAALVHSGDSLVVFDFIRSVLLVYEADRSFRRKSREVQEFGRARIIMIGISDEGYVAQEYPDYPRGTRRDTSDHDRVIVFDGDRTTERVVTTIPSREMSYEDGGASTFKPYGSMTICGTGGIHVVCVANGYPMLRRFDLQTAAEERLALAFEPIQLDRDDAASSINPRIFEIFPDAANFPSHYPAVEHLIVADDGRVWLKMFLDGDVETTDYWIVDMDRRTAWQASLSGNVLIYAVRDEKAYGVEIQEDNVTNVVRYNISPDR